MTTKAPLRRNRDFMLLQVGQLLSTAGTQSAVIAYPLLVLAVTHSPAKAGIVNFARLLPRHARLRLDARAVAEGELRTRVGDRFSPVRPPDMKITHGPSPTRTKMCSVSGGQWTKSGVQLFEARFLDRVPLLS